jgi:hypothetical protein
MMETITLDGRKFQGVTHHTDGSDLTANRSDYILAQLRLAGRVPHDLADDKRTTVVERADALLTQILLSARGPYILAGCMTEEGKVWCRSAADANAARFAEITDIGEKAVMRNELVAFVVSFCSGASATSEKSSTESAAPTTGNVTPSTPATVRH